MAVNSEQNPFLQNLPQLLSAFVQYSGVGIDPGTLPDFPRVGAVVPQNLTKSHSGRGATQPEDIPIIYLTLWHPGQKPAPLPLPYHTKVRTAYGFAVKRRKILMLYVAS
jgi:hypothetical protein